MTLIRLLTDLDGRIGRTSFWIGSIVVALGVFALQKLGGQIGGLAGDRLGAFVGAFALFPWAALAAKRAADRGFPRVYGIGLVSAIVLLGLAEPLIDRGLKPTLISITTLIWLLALIDLGLLRGDAPQGAQAGAAAGSAGREKHPAG
ncbi:MAG: DUF805 domain-containing protein [Bosea sp. (in: a-proteobacteria)]